MGTRTRRAVIAALAALALLTTAVSASALSAGDFDPSFSDDGYFVDPIGDPTPDNRRAAVPADIAVLPDSRIITAGFATPSQTLVARFNPDGTFDSSFDGDGKVLGRFGAGPGSLNLYAMDLAPDGKIVVAGDFATGGVTQAWAARLNSDGSRDETFGSGGFWTKQLSNAPSSPYTQIWDVKVRPSGKVVLLGQDNSSFVLAQLDELGQLDGSFGSGGVTIRNFGFGTTPLSSGYALQLQSDGRILVGGRASDNNVEPVGVIARFEADGKALDPSFGNGGVAPRIDVNGSGFSLGGLAIAPDGEVVAAGSARDNLNNARGAAVRLGGDGKALDPEFANAGVFMTSLAQSFADVVVQPDGKPLLAGTGDGADVARLTQGGALDPSFGGTGEVHKQFAPSSNNSYFTSVALDPAGKAVAAGEALTKVGSNFDEWTVMLRVITDQAPVVPAFSATPNPAVPGAGVAFADGGSTDADGSVTGYTWDFGDGATAVGPTAEHTYAAPGTYDVKLTARDDYGLTTSTTQPVTVVTPGGGRLDPVLVVPKLSGLVLKPAAFAAAKRGASIAKVGATVSYTASSASTTTFIVARQAPGRRSGKRCVKPTKQNARARACKRYLRVKGSFKRVDKVGANSFRFTGRVGGKSLPKGRYRLTARPVLGSTAGKAAVAAFRIK